MTQQEKFDFVLKHLAVLRDGLLTISTDETFQKFIHLEVENQFNDDYQVLLKSVFNKKAELYKQASSSIYIKDASFKNSLNAFTNIIDGKEQIDLYPQLFIPNYETINKLNQNPTIVCFSGDDNIEKAIGIKIDSEGVPIEVMVDEEYTLNNEVWVLSLSEGDVFKNPLVESVENSLDNPRSESSLNRINQSIQAQLFRFI